MTESIESRNAIQEMPTSILERAKKEIETDPGATPEDQERLETIRNELHERIAELHTGFRREGWKILREEITNKRIVREVVISLIAVVAAIILWIATEAGYALALAIGLMIGGKSVQWVIKREAEEIERVKEMDKRGR